MQHVPREDRALRVCSNCRTVGSLKYVGHTHGKEYICRPCWTKLYEVQSRMKKAIGRNYLWTCEG